MHPNSRFGRNSIALHIQPDDGIRIGLLATRPGGTLTLDRRRNPLLVREQRCRHRQGTERLLDAASRRDVG